MGPIETVTEECRRRNRGTIYNVARGIAFRRRCSSWRCDDCSRNKARDLRKRLARVNWTKFLTITMPPGRGWAKRPNIAYQAEHLRSLMRALRRRYARFNYVWIREVGMARAECVCAASLLDCCCGANGARLHLHMLLDIAAWIPDQWLKATAARCGLGFVKLLAVRGNRADSYLIKYLTKGSDIFPHGTRRFQVVGVPRKTPSEGWQYTSRRIELVVIDTFGAPECECLIDWWSSG